MCATLVYILNQSQNFPYVRDWYLQVVFITELCKYWIKHRADFLNHTTIKHHSQRLRVQFSLPLLSTYTIYIYIYQVEAVIKSWWSICGQQCVLVLLASQSNLALHCSTLIKALKTTFRFLFPIHLEAYNVATV